MKIRWKLDRLDEEVDEDPSTSECLLEIEGFIECDGRRAGLVDVTYLFSEEPESQAAFFELWDLDGRTCGVYEEIIDSDRRMFRDPLPQLLETAPGILCVHFIALQPAFRRRGLGLEVMREVVRNFADDRTGAVLLDATPLQHLPRGYDDFFDEVRDLPWNAPEEDHERLVGHFTAWGMRRLPRTRFMLAAPDVFDDGARSLWYPDLLFGPDGPRTED